MGDQIVEVNGHSFMNILHKEAVTILKSYSPLLMTIKVQILGGGALQCADGVAFISHLTVVSGNYTDTA